MEAHTAYSTKKSWIGFIRAIKGKKDREVGYYLISPIRVLLPRVWLGYIRCTDDHHVHLSLIVW